MQLGLVTQAVKEAADRLDANPKVDEFEAFLKKYSAVLHQNHVILIDKKYTLAKMYGRMEGKLQHLIYFFKYSFCELPTKKVLACLFMTKIDNKQTLSRSAHRTPNFTNPELQFPQFKVLQSGFFLFNIKSYIGIFGCILILI